MCSSVKWFTVVCSTVMCSAMKWITLQCSTMQWTACSACSAAQWIPVVCSGLQCRTFLGEWRREWSCPGGQGRYWKVGELFQSKICHFIKTRTEEGLELCKPLKGIPWLNIKTMRKFIIEQLPYFFSAKNLFQLFGNNYLRTLILIKINMAPFIVRFASHRKCTH